jgi:hypothetical protein
VFFTHIHLEALDGVAFVASDQPTDVIRPLVDLQRGTPATRKTAVPPRTTIPPTRSLLQSYSLPPLRAGVSSRTAKVEPRGLEPLTFCLPDRCSTS